MSKETNIHHPSENLENDLEMLPEYDFSQGVRGKHYLPNLTDKDEPIIIKIQTQDTEKSIQVRIIETEADITPDGTLTAQVPSDIPPGKYRVILRIEQLDRYYQQ